jgi:hypothetical protein
MPSISYSQRILFETCLSIKKGEECSPTLVSKNLADSLSENDLQNYLECSYPKLPEHIRDLVRLNLQESEILKEEKLTDIQKGTNHEIVKDEIPHPPAIAPVSKEGDTFPANFTPSVFKLPMGKAKSERRIKDFKEFLKAINHIEPDKNKI